MARWTEAELAALRVAGRDYRRFVELTGGSKSYDAFEVKSRRVRLTESATSSPELAPKYDRVFWIALGLVVLVAVLIVLYAKCHA